MKKRVLSLILALVLCVGMLPTAASAATEPDEKTVRAIETMPDNPGRPVLVDVKQTNFWAGEKYWTYPETREEVFAEIEKLTNDLIKGKRSDTEKAKAIYEWVAENISYDYENKSKGKYDVSDLKLAYQNPMQAYYRRTGVCEGYARLTLMMCVLAGLPSAYIIGTARGTSENGPEHAWNAVYADGRWIFCDATWEEWDMSPYFHKITHRIEIRGELNTFYFNSNPEINLMTQKGYKISKDLVIPEYVDVLRGSSFAQNTEIETVTVPKNVRLVSGTFMYCPNLKSITFEGGPDSKLTEVGGFPECTSLTELVIPEGVTKVRDFSKCTSLRSVVLPNSVTELTDRAFMDCASLQTVTLSNALKIIDFHTFSGCSSLKSITIPNSVTKIEGCAFLNCSSLESVYIPGSVTYINQYNVFDGCPNAVIYTEPGSYAETYAKENKIKVVTSGMPAPTPVPSNTPSGWAQPEVTAATQAGLVPADLLNSYTSAITREEFCRLMVKLIEADSGKDIASYVASQGKEISAPFTDSSAQEVKAAYALGIVNGVSAAKFNPSGSITRQEAAAMLERTAKVLGLTSGSGMSFSDSDKIASWATGSVAFVSGLTDPTTGGRVMGGTGSGFSPTGTYTREQAIATALRLFHCAA